MTRPRAAFVVTLAAVASVAAACGGGHRTAVSPEPAAATTIAPATTSTSTTPPAPTTTAPHGPPAPLTGLPESTAAQADDPAVVVKIDNVVGALPQTGVGQADVVYEELVEGGLTRLAAVYQSQYPAVVGPVRSGRLTDIALLDDLHHPVFAFAGSNGIFLPLLREQPLTDDDIDNRGDLFFLRGPHPAPHDTYTDVAVDAGTDHPSGPPPALFDFRAAATALSGAGATPATHLSVSWPTASASWTWNPATGEWGRVQDGAPDVDATGTQVTAANVVVQVVPYVTSITVDEPSSGLTPVPEGELLGSGPVWVFSSGGVISGTWSRTSESTRTTYTDAAGAPITFSPGRTWVELTESGTAPSFG